MFKQDDICKLVFIMKGKIVALTKEILIMKKKQSELINNLRKIGLF